MSFNLGLPPKGPPPPFAAWTVRQLKVVERAITLAWSQLMAAPDGSALVASAIERDITAMLQEQLLALLNSGEVRGFTAAVFGAPIRGQELENHSGKEKEKRPDLTFPRFGARPLSNHNALFYECKILGRGRTLDAYVQDGVMRFVDGRYAWGMPHAGMIAYVAAPHPTDPCDVLHQRWVRAESADPCVPVRDVERDASTDPSIAISTHARVFPLRNGEEPGDIVLRHLWLVTAD